MSIKQTTVRASTLLTVLCLSAALTITSCGKKDKVVTTDTPATGGATTPATGGTALSASEKAQMTSAKTALVMANSAVKSGDMTKAKAQLTKFNSLLPAVEPVLKAKAGANYPAISSGIEQAKTAMSSATPDKAKAGEGLTTAIKGMTTVIDKK
ncbi:MAG: hypothetical protein LH613_02855 [Chamaesiphon sp.]|nr:hypothetical protein [Chamaesiphon sp.]